MLGKDVSVEAERLETLQQDVKFVNNLLSQCGMEAPFPFARVVAEAHTTSDIYNLETAVKILIRLLNSKQVSPLGLLIRQLRVERNGLQD